MLVTFLMKLIPVFFCFEIYTCRPKSKSNLHTAQQLFGDIISHTKPTGRNLTAVQRQLKVSSCVLLPRGSHQLHQLVHVARVLDVGSHVHRITNGSRGLRERTSGRLEARTVRAGRRFRRSTSRQCWREAERQKATITGAEREVREAGEGTHLQHRELRQIGRASGEVRDRKLGHILSEQHEMSASGQQQHRHEVVRRTTAHVVHEVDA